MKTREIIQSIFLVAATICSIITLSLVLIATCNEFNQFWMSILEVSLISTVSTFSIWMIFVTIEIVISEIKMNRK
jgi:hypothetical protein